MSEAGPRRALITALATTTVTVLPVFLVGGLAVQIGAELDFGPAGLGLVVALYFGVSALTSLPAGVLVERFGAALTSRIGILTVSASMLAIALSARSYPTLVATLLVSAGGNALGQLSSNVVLAQGVPVHRQGISFGVKQAAIPLCTLLAGAAVPTIALTVGWRWAFVLGAALGIAALFTTAHEPPRRTGPPRPAARSDRATAALAVVGAGAALAAGAASALGIFLVDSAVSQGIEVTIAAATLTIGSVIGLAARLLGGWLADRRSGGHLKVVSGLLVLGGFGLALLAVPGIAALLIGTALGFGLGWSWPGLLNFAVVRLHPAAPAAATSITQLGVYVGACGGPITFGLLAAHLGYSAAWLFAAVTMVASAGLVIVGRQMLVTHRQSRRAQTGDMPRRPRVWS